VLGLHAGVLAVHLDGGIGDIKCDKLELHR
jgi:hypothetical protein